MFVTKRCSATRTRRTSRLLRQTLADLASVLEVDVPALLLAGRVLQRKGEDGVALLDGVFAVGIIGKSLADGIEGLRGRELVY